MPQFDFIVGEHEFTVIHVVQQLTDQLCGFRHITTGEMVRYFVLRQAKLVDHLCEVTLIRKPDGRYTPRLAFSIRNRRREITASPESSGPPRVRARVDLSECHENYWHLVSYLKSLRELDIPDRHFSLTPDSVNYIRIALKSPQRQETVDALQAIIDDPAFDLSIADAVQLKRRRERLHEFETAFDDHGLEPWWQNFFDNNHWIFGYGLDYRIIRKEESQANVGGGTFARSGEKRTDFLGATSGDARFTVLVEIKTPDTAILQGQKPQRNGAWSLSRPLADAVTQAQAQAHSWETASRQHPNAVELAKRQLFTFRPRVIIVIGRLSELAGDDSKLSTFELFRQSLHGIEVLTFDELLERAKFIVSLMAQSHEDGTKDCGYGAGGHR